MKRLLILLLVLLPLAACMPTTDDPPIDEPEKVTLLETTNLDSEYVRWLGRHHTIDGSEYFYYPATGFQVAFTGSAVNITLALEDKQNSIYFTLAKDNEALLDAEVVILSEAVQTFTVTFDTYGDHTVTMVKRSEAEDGNTSLQSVETNGEFHAVPTPSDDTPHFLIIGASGISGHGALGQAWESRTTANSSALHSFGYLTAERFGGTFEFVSNSGWGLAFGFNDRTGVRNIQGAYESVGIDAYQFIVDEPYDHDVVPDIILVNIGGNDYSSVINNLSGFDKDEKIQEFKTAVGTFLLKLRADAPEAHIFWTMTAGSQNGTAAMQVIALLPIADQPYVHVVVIPSPGDDGDPIGANGHASYVTHVKSADILMQEIETTTSWVHQEE